MADSARNPADSHHRTSRSELSERLDGARDLYLLALALGERREGFEPFGRMIREARIHFEEVIEYGQPNDLKLISRVFNTHHIPMDVFHGKRIRPVTCPAG